MIPRSSTITDPGRQMRNRLLWGVATVVTLLVLAFVFVFLDRSTVIGGPTGSSFVTTATGIAALHDTLERDGRLPVRIQQPVTTGTLDQLQAYLLADVEFAQFEEFELSTLTRFVDDGGAVLVLGVPPPALVEAFDIEAVWTGARVGDVPMQEPLPHTHRVDGSRFGSFEAGHGGDTLAGSPDGDLVVGFERGEGIVILIADSSLGHNATVDRADNIDLFGDLLAGRTGFDEYRHGYTDTPATGLMDAAPGNWRGAALLGAIVLVLTLVSYGRRFGPIEPGSRTLVPERSTYIDSVARALRRADGVIPSAPLRTLLLRRLGLSQDADIGEIISAARRAGVPPDVLADLERGNADDAKAIDSTLAVLFDKRGTSR